MLVASAGQGCTESALNPRCWCPLLLPGVGVGVSECPVKVQGDLSALIPLPLLPSPFFHTCTRLSLGVVSILALVTGPGSASPAPALLAPICWLPELGLAQVPSFYITDKSAVGSVETWVCPLIRQFLQSSLCSGSVASSPHCPFLAREREPAYSSLQV